MSAQYDKQQRVLAFYQELATLTQQATKGQQALTSAGAQADLAKADADGQAQQAIKQQVVNIKRVTDLAIKLATEKAKRDDLEGVERLLGQLEARLENYGNIQKELRNMEAQFELAAAMGEFAEGAAGLSRGDAETMIAQIRERGEKQLQLADDLVPSAPILLRLS